MPPQTCTVCSREIPKKGFKCPTCEDVILCVLCKASKLHSKHELEEVDFENDDGENGANDELLTLVRISTCFAIHFLTHTLILCPFSSLPCVFIVTAYYHPVSYTCFVFACTKACLVRLLSQEDIAEHEEEIQNQAAEFYGDINPEECTAVKV